MDHEDRQQKSKAGTLELVCILGMCETLGQKDGACVSDQAGEV